jgi:hypothetical protein
MSLGFQAGNGGVEPFGKFKTGGNCKVKTGCRKSSKVSNSVTESKSGQKLNPPLDSCRHQKSAIAPLLEAKLTS